MINQGAPSFVRAGVRVWYETEPGVKFAAVVEADAHEVDGQWFVRLIDLGDDFAAWSISGERFVNDVPVGHLAPREEDPEP